MSTQKNGLLTIPKIVLSTRDVMENYTLDATIQGPPGFIALRDPDNDNVVQFVKVSQIVTFRADKKDLSDLWYYFDVLPETVQTKEV